MDRAFDIQINTLPAYTWNWLHMNEVQMKGVRVSGAETLREEIPDGVSAEDSAEPVFAEVQSGCGSDMDKMIREMEISTRVYRAGKGMHLSVPVRTALAYTDQGRMYDLSQNKKRSGAVAAPNYENPEGRINAFAIHLEKDSEMTVVMDYTSASDAKGLAAVQTKITAEENSVLHLIQIQRLGDGFTFLHDIGGTCADNARIEVIRLILGGRNTYEGCRIALPGYRAYASVDTGYQVSGDGHLDMNYDIYHTGKKTKCEMNAAGVLRDNAFKLYRGTIDFQKGCAGAEGDELEDVLLMDDTVTNQTIPIILCAEEDVVGNHGATIGRIDENLLFYMEARGMKKEEIYEMMAKARIDAVIHKIPDAQTRKVLGETEGE